MSQMSWKYPCLSKRLCFCTCVRVRRLFRCRQTSLGGGLLCIARLFPQGSRKHPFERVATLLPKPDKLIVCRKSCPRTTMHFTWAAMHHWNSSRPERPCTQPACGGRAGSLDLAAADARAGFSRAVRAWHLISTQPRPRRARQPSRFRRCYTRLPRAHRQHSCAQR